MADGINAALQSLNHYAAANVNNTVADWVSQWAPASDSNANALSTVEGGLATVFWQNDPDFIHYQYSAATSYAGTLRLGSLVQYPSLAMKLLSAFAQDERFRSNSNECG